MLLILKIKEQINKLYDDLKVSLKNKEHIHLHLTLILPKRVLLNITFRVTLLSFDHYHFKNQLSILSKTLLQQ